MSLQNWLQLLIPLLFVLGPVAGKIFQKLGEAKKERERIQRSQRAQIEALRTGRAADTNAPFRDPSAQTLGIGDTPAPVMGTPQQALTRNAPPQVRTVNRPQTRILRLPGGLTIEVPIEPEQPARVQPARVQPARAQQVQQPQPTRNQKQQKRKAPRQIEAPKQAPISQAGTYEVTQREVFNSAADTAAALIAAPRQAAQPARNAVQAGGRSSGLGALLPRGATPADVRKAMVLSEIFGPPVGGR